MGQQMETCRSATSCQTAQAPDWRCSQCGRCRHEAPTLIACCSRCSLHSPFMKSDVKQSRWDMSCPDQLDDREEERLRVQEIAALAAAESDVLAQELTDVKYFEQIGGLGETATVDVANGFTRDQQADLASTNGGTDHGTANGTNCDITSPSSKENSDAGNNGYPSFAVPSSPSAALRRVSNRLLPGNGISKAREMSSGLVLLCESVAAGVRSICCTQRAVAVVKSDGSVVAWGVCEYGGRHKVLYNVVGMCATSRAFAVWRQDGSVATWGCRSRGGDSKSVRVKLQGVSSVHSTLEAFAAVTDKGSVIAWGHPQMGGDSSLIDDQLAEGVQDIVSNFYAFAALKHDGSVVTWGRWRYGGGSFYVRDQLSKGVRQLCSTHAAFAALKQDGSVVNWGTAGYGGDPGPLRHKLQSGVRALYSSYGAFAAITEDGSLVTWGHQSYGGDSSAVCHELARGIKQVQSTHYAFAAIREDGSVVTWGSAVYGGDSSSVREHLRNGVHHVESTDYAFAALKHNGSLVTWGHPEYGGCCERVKEYLKEVREIFSTHHAFAIRTRDGRTFAWGHCEDAEGGLSDDSDSDEDELDFSESTSTYDRASTMRSRGYADVAHCDSLSPGIRPIGSGVRPRWKNSTAPSKYDSVFRVASMRGAVSSWADNKADVSRASSWDRAFGSDERWLAVRERLASVQEGLSEDKGRK